MAVSVQLSVDTSDFHGGNQSLRITFKGPAVPDAGFFQYVPAHPNTEYPFSAYTKAQDIDSASGPALQPLMLTPAVHTSRPTILLGSSCRHQNSSNDHSNRSIRHDERILY